MRARASVDAREDLPRHRERFLFMVAHCVAALLASYLPGDPVPLSRRIQQNGRRSAWHEVPHRAAPRFLTDWRTTLDVPHADAADPEALKISLALHNLQFVTPWITVSDGKGRFLSHLDLSLTASGDALTAVRWEPEYVEQEPPEHISVHTTWEHAKEHDLESALAFLFLSCAFISAWVLYTVCQKHGRSTLAKVFSDDEGSSYLEGEQQRLARNDELAPYRRSSRKYD